MTIAFDAQNALRESEDAFRKLFEDIGDPILLLKDGRFVDCNVATLKLLGFQSKSECLSCSPSDLSPPFQPETI